MMGRRLVQTNEEDKDGWDEGGMFANPDGCDEAIRV